MLVDLASATRSNGESPEGLGVNTDSDDTGEGGAILGDGIGGAVALGTLFGVEGAGIDGGGGEGVGEEDLEGVGHPFEDARD